jgi:dihydrofolate reductase
MISLVVAAAENGVIGRGGALPWRLSDDLRRFKALTTGKPVVMGRKTFESIGRPLPGRRNIVMTRDDSYQAEGCDVVGSPEAALAAAREAPEVMVIGGAEVYRQFLPLAGRIHLTRVHAAIEGDTFLPAIDPALWTEVSQTRHPADQRNDFDMSFIILERR